MVKECKTKKELSRAPRIVVIGGGTGLSILLRGLKKFTSNITAIVTVADNGGGSGVLREDLGMLPPGDIRACLLALANTEPSMEKLLQYRFEEGILKGQNFGNLFIAAMNEIHGSFEQAIRETSNVLAVTGKVLPMTLDTVDLCAILEDGSRVVGESEIPEIAYEKNKKISKIYTEPKILNPVLESVEAVNNADLIVLGPGSLYTSVIPNLLVNNMVGHIFESEAPKIYIGNIMTQKGETDDYTLYDHVDAILKHSKNNLIDYVIGNVGKIDDETLRKYEEEKSKPVFIKDRDRLKLRENNIDLIEANLVNVKNNYVRHDNVKVSEIILEIAEDARMGKKGNTKIYRR